MSILGIWCSLEKAITNKYVSTPLDFNRKLILTIDTVNGVNSLYDECYPCIIDECLHIISKF